VGEVRHTSREEEVSLQRDRVRQAWNLDRLWWKQRNKKRARLLSALCGVIALALVAFLVVRWATSAPPVGDPHGQVLTELKSEVVPAVPPEATKIKTHSEDSTWHGKCPDNPSGSSGWYEVHVQSQFTSTTAEVSLAKAVGKVLGREGWTRHDKAIRFYPYSLTPTEDSPIERVEPQWSKPMGTGSSLTAVLYPDDRGANDWVLDSSWLPPGYSLPGC
jgi:hypothetical protein